MIYKNLCVFATWRLCVDLHGLELVEIQPTPLRIFKISLTTFEVVWVYIFLYCGRIDSIH